jgi:hypothetical protein
VSFSTGTEFDPRAALLSQLVERALGNEEKVLDAWETIIENHGVFSRFIRFYVQSLPGGKLVNIETNPRYQALLKKVNLDDAALAEWERTIEF